MQGDRPRFRAGKTPRGIRSGCKRMPAQPQMSQTINSTDSGTPSSQAMKYGI
jgi:hypothetical protein